MEILGTYNNALFDGSAVRKAPAETLNNAKNSKNREKIAQAAEDFEAFFITKTMETMFEGISTDGMFGGGHAEKYTVRCCLTNTAKLWPRPAALASKTR